MSGGFKFYHRPPQPVLSRNVGRKCIVCGTTKHETDMKPFMLKGEQLNLWVNNHFANKRIKLFNFFAKLRYTINPFACVEHFTNLPDTSRHYERKSKGVPSLPLLGKRNVSDLIVEGEEPPTIAKIIGGKPEPEPEAPKSARSEQEVNNVVMGILKAARHEMDKEEKMHKMLRKITRNVMNQGECDDTGTPVFRKKRKEEREERRREKRERREQRAAAAAARASATAKRGGAAEDGDGTTEAEDVGSDDDDDNSSTIDVEAIDSPVEEEKETSSSDESSSSSSEYEEDSDGESRSPSSDKYQQRPQPSTTPIPRPITIAVPRLHAPPNTALRVPVLVPRFRPYSIAAPNRLQTAAGNASLPLPPFPHAHPAHPPHKALQLQKNSVQPPVCRAVMNVPRRLTLAPGFGPATPVRRFDRPSWVAPNPGQNTLASVLQRFWNEDPNRAGVSGGYNIRDGRTFPLPSRIATAAPAPFGQTLLPGTSTKFKPAATLASSALLTARPLTPSPTKPPIHHTSIRYSAIMHNPPLSPSRLIIGSEETVTTTVEYEEPQVELSSSSSDEDDENSEVEVCDSASVRAATVVEGVKIEGEVEAKSVKSWSTCSTYSEESSEAAASSSDEADDVINKAAMAHTDTVAEVSDKEDEDKTADMVATPTITMAAPSHHHHHRHHHHHQHAHSIDDHRDPHGTGDRQKKPLVSAIVRTAHSKYWRAVSHNRRIIHPPSAMLKPPTKLLSTGQHYSMKELLHAQARASTALPAHIDTTGLVAALPRRRGPRPKDMPRLFSQAATNKRQSEWARLEMVVERKLAEHKAQLAREKKARQQKLVDPVLMSENPPPVLDLQGRLALLKRSDLDDDSAARGSKVLRMRFHRKDEILRKMKAFSILDRSTCPKGVGLEIEVEDTVPMTMAMVDKIEQTMELISLSRKEKKDERRRKKWEVQEKKSREVTNPTLVIEKTDIIEMQERKDDELLDDILLLPEHEQQCLNVPPPTPVIGIPGKEELAARREMYEKKRHETLQRGGFLPGTMIRSFTPLPQRHVHSKRLKMGRPEAVPEGGRRRGGGGDCDEEADALVAEAMKIVKIAKTEKVEKTKEAEERREEKEMEVVRKRREGMEEGIMVISDIEDDYDDEVMEEKEEEEDEKEEVKEKQKRPRNEDKDKEWTKPGVTTGRRANEDSDASAPPPQPRKSHRLSEKRQSQPPNKSRFYWKMSDDEETLALERAAAIVAEAHATPVEKRKRGRPRKSDAPPPKKKREENVVMTEQEKEVLSRVLASSASEGDKKSERRKKIEEDYLGSEKATKSADEIEETLMMAVFPKRTKPDATFDENPMEMLEDGCGEARDAEETLKEGEEEEKKEEEPEKAEVVSPMACLEKQEPKPAADDPVLSTDHRKAIPWSWKQRLGRDLAMNNTMGGRLCNYCVKHAKRYIWIANEATALMDHARIHCVETLMCPNKNCTYMNTQRSRISQHVSYVHKKWGMPIDLAEMYPSMRNSLMLRLRHCFPDLPNLSVCQMCRVAVRSEPDYLRWHAQTHMDTQCFECTRDICVQKFSSEQECLDHIAKTKCRGSVVNGMSDEMEEEVSQLVGQCFRRRPIPALFPKKKIIVPAAPVLARQVPLTIPAASKPLTPIEDKEEKRQVLERKDEEMEKKEDEIEKKEEGETEVLAREDPEKEDETERNDEEMEEIKDEEEEENASANQ